MKIKVMYHSRTGNTRKVAEAIAETVGVGAEAISGTNLTETVDLLFIGDGIYGQKLDPKTEDLIKKLNAGQVKNTAVFGTYCGQTKALTQMQEMLKQQGIQVTEESFGCKGKFCLIINRSHPDEEDLKAAKEFARRIVAKTEKLKSK